MDPAIAAPLQLVRSLYAAQSDRDGDDFGVKARFSALVADPQLGAKASIQMPLTCRAGRRPPMTDSKR